MRVKVKLKRIETFLLEEKFPKHISTVFLYNTNKELVVVEFPDAVYIQYLYHSAVEFSILIGEKALITFLQQQLLTVVPATMQI